MRTAVAVAVPLIVAAPIVAAVIASHGTPQECGGQCKAPYQLDVYFRHGTSQVDAQRALASCVRLPTVIRASGVRRSEAHLEGHIYTTKETLPGQPLISCLRRQPDVEDAGWPE
jgi:hypothetical protein